jgi:hypothetical protein
MDQLIKNCVADPETFEKPIKKQSTLLLLQKKT